MARRTLSHAVLAVTLSAPLAVSVAPWPALAQQAAAPSLSAQNTAEEDRGYLTAFLEDNLSGAGRQVRITGFAGSLSARASLDTLTIADDQGEWFRLKGVTLDWSRAALLKGRVEIAALKADLIEVLRAPVAAASADPAAPEATPFSLPELPVSVRIDTIEAKRIALGATLLGQPVSFSLKGSTSLADGAGQIALALERLDSGPSGQFDLSASYSNADKRLSIDLMAQEQAGGLAATLAGLPGAPELKLAVAGAGPLDDFTADIALSSDGAPRLAGQVVLSTLPAPVPASGAAPVTEQNDGQNAEQSAEQNSGQSATPPAEAAAPLRHLEARLGGDIAALFLPEYRPFFGDNIALRLSGGQRADGGLRLDHLTLTSKAMRLSGDLTLDAQRWPEQFALEATIKDAAGRAVLLPFKGEKTRIDGAALDLRFDRAKGEEWQGSLAVDGLDRAALEARRLGLSATGYIRETKPGNLGSAFAVLNYAAEGLDVGRADLARALGADILGGARITFVKREPLRIEDLTVSGDDYGLSGDITMIGDLEAIDVTADLDLRAQDLSRFAPLVGQNLRGAAQLGIKGTLEPLSGAFDLTAAGQTQDLAIGQADADRLLRGQGTVDLAVRRDQGGLHLARATAETRAISASVAGDITSTRTDLTAAARLADVAGYVEGLRGPLSLTADLGRDGAGPWQVTLDADGPAATRAALRGTLGAGFDRADVEITAAGPLALANPFIHPRSIGGTANIDLALNGPFALRSLSGQITTRGARFSAPALRSTLTELDATTTLSGGMAQVEVGAAVNTGGRVRMSGPVALSAPYSGNLEIRFDDVGLKDPQLYTSSVAGQITVNGPLAGGAAVTGALELGETNLRVPDSGFGAATDFPEMVHLGEPAAARASRARAGLISEGTEAGRAAQTGPSYPLDIRIGAPRRIFLRGRGIDAELGGFLRLRGTSAAIQPSGRFDLVRGRLDILGKRFTLDEGYAQLIGDFTPYIRLAASTQTSDTQISIVIEGDAAQPDISFLSSPELPQDEVLARLLFGRAINEISALQAAQLAAAVATLAGKGGAGVIGKLRDNFGLDDLDLTTSEDGETSLRAGRYISENIYTDVTVGSTGTSEINLNLDVSPNLTVKGGLSSDGNTGIGIYFEKDY